MTHLFQAFTQYKESKAQRKEQLKREHQQHEQSIKTLKVQQQINQLNVAYQHLTEAVDSLEQQMNGSSVVLNSTQKKALNNFITKVNKLSIAPQNIEELLAEASLKDIDATHKRMLGLVQYATSLVSHKTFSEEFFPLIEAETNKIQTLDTLTKNVYTKTALVIGLAAVAVALTAVVIACPVLFPAFFFSAPFYTSALLMLTSSLLVGGALGAISATCGAVAIGSHHNNHLGVETGDLIEAFPDVVPADENGHFM